MENKLSFNADIGGSISELEQAMKGLPLKKKLHEILLRGKGLEFDSYRNYTPDDDASLIDWKASKRANKYLVRQYRDETNLKVVFIIDTGENMVFGSTEKLKCEYSAEVVAAFSKIVMSYGNNAGFVFFGDSVKEYLPPSRGKMSFQRAISFLTNPEIYGGTPNLTNSLEFSLKLLPRAIDSVVVVSDFISLQRDFAKKFKELSGRFEVLAVRIQDPVDYSLPEKFSGEFIIEDPNTGEQIILNPKVAKKTYEKISSENRKKISQFFIEENIDLVDLQTDKKFVPELATFLGQRLNRRRYLK